MPRAEAIDQALINKETLKTYIYKISLEDYMKRTTMSCLKQEILPLSDALAKDSVYLRDISQEYTWNTFFVYETHPKQIHRLT